MSLTRNYELYLETEKALHKFAIETSLRKDPMERLAKKIKRGESLWLQDLRIWVGYNFLVFSEEEQAKIKTLAEKQ